MAVNRESNHNRYKNGKKFPSCQTALDFKKSLPAAAMPVATPTASRKPMIANLPFGTLNISSVTMPRRRLEYRIVK